jgi:hypothetical protein
MFSIFGRGSKWDMGLHRDTYDHGCMFSNRLCF